MRAYTFHGKRNICGDRIREARLKLRYSQSDLCKQLQLIGIPMERDSISRIESGSRYVADYEVKPAWYGTAPVFCAMGGLA